MTITTKMKIMGMNRSIIRIHLKILSRNYFFIKGKEKIMKVESFEIQS